MNSSLTVTGDPGNITGLFVNGREYLPYGEIPCNPGDKVTFYHDPGRFWHYYDRQGKIHHLKSKADLSFTVPADAYGRAEIYLRSGIGDYNYEVVRLDRSEGWVTEVTPY